VGHDDAKGGVDKEGLGILPASSSHGRITRVADPDGSAQSLRIGGIEDVVDKPVALLGVEAPVICDHAGGILSAVLDSQDALVQVLEHVFVAGDSYYAAHISLLYWIIHKEYRHSNIETKLCIVDILYPPGAPILPHRLRHGPIDVVHYAS
jgi:hypothetical protein